MSVSCQACALAAQNCAIRSRTVSLIPALPPAELSARARACRAYAGIKEHDLAEATGIQPERLRRILRATHPSRATVDELLVIADACDVPRAFVEHGFGALPTDEPNLAERVQALEAKVDTVLDIIGTRLTVAIPAAGAGQAGVSPGRGTAGPGREGDR